MIQPRAKNAFLTFIFSIIPGCAHLYMGFMRRGAQALAASGLVFLLALLLELPELGATVILFLTAYTFFEAWHYRRLLREGVDVPDIPYVPLPKSPISSRTLGLVALTVGVILFARELLVVLVQYVFPAFAHYLYALAGFMPSMLIVLLGMWLLLRGGKPPDKNNGD